MFESIKNKIKNFEPLTKNSYGRLWNEKSGNNQLDWYTEMHNSCLPMHKDFIDFLKKNSFKTILEIGCGTGYYPINSHDLFKDKIYTGLDFSQTAIETCKRNSKFDFICTDFIKFNFEKKFDFIFSHAVIDHVYDIEKFISEDDPVSIAKYLFEKISEIKFVLQDTQKDIITRSLDLYGSNDLGISRVLTKVFVKKILRTGFNPSKSENQTRKIIDSADWPYC